jgi:hypothetical protein
VGLVALRRVGPRLAARLNDRGVPCVPSVERGRNGRSAAISTIISVLMRLP